MVARDDPTPWPTGLRTIQLVADSENGRFIASENYEPCSEPAERRVVATYTVPQKPPAIVRLTALAEDHAKHMETDIGEFPTVEMWKGSVKLERDEINPSCSPITSTTEFAITVADDGDVSGSGMFDHSSGKCVGGYTASATRVPVKIGGKKQGGTFNIFLKDFQALNAPVPRLPAGYWIVRVGDRSTGEATFSPFPHQKVVFRVKLECQTCNQP